MTTPRVVLRARQAQPFFARHPWVYPGAIARVEGDPTDGGEVELITHENVFIARGLYNSVSKIRVRLYSWEPERTLDREFFREKLSRSIQFRNTLGLRGPDQGCRLFFSEADGLSGLTIDEYAGYLSVQFTSAGLALRREMLLDLLEELVPAKGIIGRTEKGIATLEGLTLRDGLLRGESPPRDLVIQENGLRFLVNLIEGQKTGHYLDQRDNRQATARLARGRTVLDAYCYTGGFGLHAAKAGAVSVECVDASEPALAMGRTNATINGLANVEFVHADIFDHLETRQREGRRYGMVILDPPKFARSRESIPQAMTGYRRLQTLATRLLEPDGILVTCCCSGLITPEMLENLFAQNSVQEKRGVQIIGKFGHAADHPVSVTCPESSYLKCYIKRVV